MNNKTRSLSMSVFFFGLVLIIANYPTDETTGTSYIASISIPNYPYTPILTSIDNAGNPTSSNPSHEKDTITSNTSIADTKPPAFFNLVDGSVAQDETLIAIFEYFLSLDGEISIENIKQRLARFATTGLNNQQIGEVLSAFMEYYAFLKFMENNQPTIASYSNYRDKYDWIKQQRRAFFGEEVADAYFGYEEAYDEYSLAKLEITTNTDLNQQERLFALRELENQLPTEIKRRQQEKAALNEAIANNRKISIAMDGNELYQSRLNSFGYEATQRLKKLDNERQEWEQRYTWYRDEAMALQESNLSEEDKIQAIERLRQNHFNDREALRVATLDKLR